MARRSWPPSDAPCSRRCWPRDSSTRWPPPARIWPRGLRALSAELGHGEVRGRGLLLALALKDLDAGKVVQAALDRGLLINAPRPDSLRFMPSLTVSRDEIDQMMGLLRESLQHG